jgi:hypothetical protein
VTAQQNENIPFERVRQAKATSQEKKVTDLQSALASSDKAAVTGRYGPSAARPHTYSGALVLYVMVTVPALPCCAA